MDSLSWMRNSSFSVLLFPLMNTMGHGARSLIPYFNSLFEPSNGVMVPKISISDLKFLDDERG